jgi:hypothetical protein
MDAFDVGSHVVIEFEDDRKLAGYILARSDDGAGLFLSATHKEAEVVYSVSAAASEEIRNGLRGKKIARLRLDAVLSGVPLAVLLKRDELVDVLVSVAEEKLLEGRDQSPQFRELSSPIRMYVNLGYIRTMEDTDDKIMESEVSLFDQTFEGELKQLLDKAEADKKEDAEADAESEDETKETNVE